MLSRNDILIGAAAAAIVCAIVCFCSAVLDQAREAVLPRAEKAAGAPEVMKRDAVSSSGSASSSAAPAEVAVPARGMTTAAGSKSTAASADAEISVEVVNPYLQIQTALAAKDGASVSPTSYSAREDSFQKYLSQITAAGAPREISSDMRHFERDPYYETFAAVSENPMQQIDNESSVPEYLHHVEQLTPNR